MQNLLYTNLILIPILQIKRTLIASYYEHFVPNFQKLADSQNLSGSQGELMTKLNHILHLLEEQQDHKTSNVTEELILYLFLGVFVIFTVDSFTKVGKYTR